MRVMYGVCMKVLKKRMKSLFNYGGLNMKRLIFSLAVIALASCVKDSPVAPVQPSDQVSIKAVAVETKTLLDGFDVVWEKTEEISVVHQ